MDIIGLNAGAPLVELLSPHNLGARILKNVAPIVPCEILTDLIGRLTL